MKKLIQILRESEDDLDWMRDTSPVKKPQVPFIVKFFNDDLSVDDLVKLIRVLHEHYDIMWPQPNNAYNLYQDREDSGGLQLFFDKPANSSYDADVLWTSDIIYVDRDTNYTGEYTFEDIMGITSLNESDDLDWVRDVVYNIPIGQWDGQKINTPNMSKLHRFTDSDGDNHLIKLGGIMYKHRTRKHGGGYFSNDGEVSFYDGKITQDQITDFNNTNENDPFEGKYRLKMSREDYNKHVRNGTLVMVPDDRLVNESNDDLDWMRDTEPVYLEDFDMVKIDGLQHRQKNPFTDDTEWEPFDIKYSRAMITGFNKEISCYDVLVLRDLDNDTVHQNICIPKKELEGLNRPHIKESKQDDFDWADEIPGVIGYGVQYRYFELTACFGIDYETEECEDTYEYNIRIPKDKVEEIWPGHIGYFGGPDDEGEGVISYAIDNGLIPNFDLDDIIMWEGVLEEDDSHFDGINESEDDLDWMRDVVIDPFGELLGNNKSLQYVGLGTQGKADEVFSWMTSLGYKWNTGGIGGEKPSPPYDDYLWVSRDGNIMVGDPDEDDIDDGREIMIANPFIDKQITESDDLDWIRDVPLITKELLLTNPVNLIGTKFKVYEPTGKSILPIDTVDSDVSFVFSDGDEILVRIDDTTQGHDGLGFGNEELISDICAGNKCWWLEPETFEIVNDMNESKDDLDWMRDTSYYIDMDSLGVTNDNNLIYFYPSISEYELEQYVIPLLKNSFDIDIVLSNNETIDHMEIHTSNDNIHEYRALFGDVSYQECGCCYSVGEQCFIDRLYGDVSEINNGRKLFKIPTKPY